MGFIEKRSGDGQYRARYRDPLGRQRSRSFARDEHALCDRTGEAEAVKPFETTSHRLVCISASGVGWLIQAAMGSFGGAGGRAKRWGLAA